MFSGTVLFVIVSLATTLQLAHGLPVEKLGYDNEFDHYVFTQQYPAGYCYTYKAKGKGYECFYPCNSTSWTIHGLWPTEGSTLGPNYCKNISFNPDDIQSLVPQLVAKWTNLLNNSGFYSFWCHEYEKHGTCTELREYDFFSKGLELFNEIGIFGTMLSKGNIIPSKETTYDADNVRSVLSNAVGVTPTLLCEKVDDDHVLQEIELCLTKDSFSPMVCPNREEADTCHSDQVLYPPSMYSVY